MPTKKTAKKTAAKKTVKKTAAKPASKEKKKSSGIRLDLISAADELNKVLSFEANPIPTDIDNETLIKDLKEASSELTINDELSEETAKVLTELKIKLPGAEKEKKTIKKTEPKAKPAAKKTTAKKSTPAPKGGKEVNKKETVKKPKTPKERKPRVIETIWDVVTSNKKILSNDEILERVAKKLPDKNPESMTNTIKAMNIQYLQKCFK